MVHRRRSLRELISTREPPLFGTEPDARVWALANEAADARTHPVLDIGAGTGRNALPWDAADTPSTWWS